MSQIKNLTSSIPIPIKYSKSWNSFSYPNNNTQKFLFELSIQFSDDNIKTFRKIEDNKKANLISLSHQIKFNDIKKFNVTISIIPSEYNYLNSDFISNTNIIDKIANKKIEKCHLAGILNQEQSYYSQNDEEAMVEFSQNSLGYTICNCFFLGEDDNYIGVSPPN